MSDPFNQSPPGIGNTPPIERSLDQRIQESWSVWKNLDLRKEINACFSDPEKKDKSAADIFAAAIVNNHQYLGVNIGKRRNMMSRPEYKHGQVISAPNAISPEQKAEFIAGVVRGLSWLEDLPTEIQSYALDALQNDFTENLAEGPIVRVVPLWEDRTKPLDKQHRVMINFTGLTPDARGGSTNEHTLILGIKNPETSQLNQLSEFNLQLMRVLPFALRNASHILNPQMGEDFFDFVTDDWAEGNEPRKVRVINFTHKFFGKVVSLPTPIRDEKGAWQVLGKDFPSADDESTQINDFASYIREKIVRPRGGNYKKDIRARVERLVRL